MSSLQKVNMVLQAKLDVIREVLVDELGLTGDDIIEVPILYHDMAEAKALVADMVNLVLVNQPEDPPKPGENLKPSTGCLCIVPKPHGPILGGVDIFEEDMRRQFEALNIDVTFCDEWYEYHINDGEIHCGTNQLPAAVPRQWWLEEDPPWDTRQKRG